MEHPFEKRLRERGFLPPKPPPAAALEPTNVIPASGDDEAARRRRYAQSALQKECEQLAALPPDTCRNQTLNAARFSMARFVNDKILTYNEVTDALTAAARACGLPDNEINTCLRGDRHEAASAVKHTRPAVPPPKIINGHVTEVNAAELKERTPGRQIRWTRGNEIQTGVPIWAWAYGGRGRIQLGTLALFAGRPGAGKSTAARWFAAQATLGHLEGIWRDQPQHVAYIAAEESARYTIGPGLIASGADMSRIHFPTVLRDGEPTKLLSTLDEYFIAEYCLNSHIAVVVVDPLMSTVTATTDINKNNEVRSQIEPWSRIADTIEGVVLGIAHLRKNSTGDVVAAVTGSSAFGEIARSVFGFAKNPDTDDRVMSQHKNSTGYEDLSLTYQIESETVVVATGETAEVGKFTITGDSEVTVEDILADGFGQQTGAGAECRRWLKDYLSVEGPIRSRTAKQEAGKEGYAARTVERAAKQLHVFAESRDFPRTTYWSLPETVAPTDPTQSRHQSRHK